MVCELDAIQMSGNSCLIPIMNSLEAKPSFLSREADHVPSHLGSLRDPNCTMPEERSEDLVNNLALFLRKKKNATPVDLNTEQDWSDELQSTRIGKPFASPRLNPFLLVILSMRGLQSLAVSLVEIRGTPRYLMGKVPSLKQKKRLRWNYLWLDGSGLGINTTPLSAFGCVRP